MPLTQNCDLFGSITEDAINNVVLDLQKQRPSLFNYGTLSFVRNPKLLCNQSILNMLDPDVFNFNNPVVSQLPLLGLPGYAGPFGLEYCLQLSELKIDFAPSNTITLPPGLNPPLAPQHFALQARLCAGLGCPPMEVLAKNGTVVGSGVFSGKDNSGLSSPTNPLQFINPICFCLDLFVVLHVQQTTSGGNTVIALILDNLEIPEIRPVGLEKSIECYIRSTLMLGILPPIQIAFSSLILNIQGILSIGPTPISANVPFNPSIEDNQLEVFISLN